MKQKMAHVKMSCSEILALHENEKRKTLLNKL